MYIPTGNDDIFALDAQDRPQDLGVQLGYPPGQRPDLLRLGQPRRRRRRGQGLLGPARRQLRRARPEDRQDRLAHAARGLPRRLQHHRRVPLLRRPGLHRHVGRRKRHPRPRVRAWTPRPATRCGASTPSRPGRHRRRHVAIADRPRSGQARRLPARRRHASGRRRRSTPTWACCTSARATPVPTTTARVRPGDNLFAASIVALDYKTGQYKWHFQEVHHDIWDYDAPSPVVLFDQMYNGVLRKGIYESGKTGWCYFLDRTNGQPLIGINETAGRAGAAPGHRRHAAVSRSATRSSTSAPTRCRASRSPGCIYDTVLGRAGRASIRWAAVAPSGARARTTRRPASCT